MILIGLSPLLVLYLIFDPEYPYIWQQVLFLMQKNSMRFLFVLLLFMNVIVDYGCEYDASFDLNSNQSLQ